VVGCGGLGGYVVEMLGRLGIGHITAVDGDVFEESNFNRQILSDETSIGISKANKAVERMSIVNSNIVVKSVFKRLTLDNGREIISGHDVVIDALDNIESRLNLQQLCEEEQIPLIHGAIAGWYGQVTTILPGDKTLNLIYKNATSNKGIEKDLGNPSFTPAHIASIQVSECLKLLLGKEQLLRNKVLFINMLDLEYDVVDF
jgi:molybdopterin-synthase adenylyltransferase